jgi:hypothetical protein
VKSAPTPDLQRGRRPAAAAAAAAAPAGPQGEVTAAALRALLTPLPRVRPGGLRRVEVTVPRYNVALRELRGLMAEHAGLAFLLRDISGACFDAGDRGLSD